MSLLGTHWSPLILYPVSQDQNAYSVPLSIAGNTTVVTWLHDWIPVYQPTNCEFALVGVVTPFPATTHVVFAVYFFVVVAVLHPLLLYVILQAFDVVCNQFLCTQHLFG